MNRQKLGSRIAQRIKLYGVAALSLGAAILFYACEQNNLEEIKAFNSAENLPVLEASNFSTLVTDSGKVMYNLEAPKLLRFETGKDSYLEFPEGMELVKYDEKRTIISSITANYAKQFVDDKKWEAKNNVIATNAQGDTLKTEHLIYEEEKGKIYTEEFVRIIRPDQIITGIGFQSDQTLQNWRIKDPKGTIYVSADAGAERTGDGVAQEKMDTLGNTGRRPAGKKLEFK